MGNGSGHYALEVRLERTIAKYEYSSGFRPRFVGSHHERHS